MSDVTLVGGVVLDAGTNHNPHEHPRCSLGRVTNSPFDLGPWPFDHCVINIANGCPVVVCDLCQDALTLRDSGQGDRLRNLNYLLQSKKQAASPVGDTPLIPGLSVHY